MSRLEEDAEARNTQRETLEAYVRDPSYKTGLKELEDLRWKVPVLNGNPVPVHSYVSDKGPLTRERPVLSTTARPTAKRKITKPEGSRKRCKTTDTIRDAEQCTSDKPTVTTQRASRQANSVRIPRRSKRIADKKSQSTIEKVASRFRDSDEMTHDGYSARSRALYERFQSRSPPQLEAASFADAFATFASQAGDESLMITDIPKDSIRAPRIHRGVEKEPEFRYRDGLSDAEDQE
ncbi:hypothetical protein ACN47E_004799 [Coniothyrium glycines]